MIVVNGNDPDPFDSPTAGLSTIPGWVEDRAPSPQPHRRQRRWTHLVPGTGSMHTLSITTVPGRQPTQYLTQHRERPSGGSDHQHTVTAPRSGSPPLRTARLTRPEHPGAPAYNSLVRGDLSAVVGRNRRTQLPHAHPARRLGQYGQDRYPRYPTSLTTPFELPNVHPHDGIGSPFSLYLLSHSWLVTGIRRVIFPWPGRWGRSYPHEAQVSRSALM